MFSGEYKHQLDTNYRIRIPTIFKNDLGGSLKITKGLGVKCLYIYSSKDYDLSFKQNFADVKITDLKAMRDKRLFSAAAMSVEDDKQGRIVIPQNLREYAEIDKNIFIIGVDDHVEIWSEENWKKYLNGDE